MKNLIYLSILFLLIFSSCSKDDVVSSGSSSTNNFSVRMVNDTVKVEFEVKGTTTSQSYNYTPLFLSTTNFIEKIKLDTITNGSIKFSVYKQDTILVFAKTFTSSVDSTYYSGSNPAVNRLEVIPVNFTGKGKFELYIR